MLSKKAFVQAMTGLSNVWKELEQAVNEPAISRMWYEVLSDLTDKQFKTGVTTVLKTFHFAPKPADIREAAFASEPRLMAAEAWAIVRADIKAGNFYWGKPNYPDWKINRTLEAFTATELREMTPQNVSVIRAQFIRIYEGLEQREKKALIVNDPKVKALIAQLTGQPQLEGGKDEQHSSSSS